MIKKPIVGNGITDDTVAIQEKMDTLHGRRRMKVSELEDYRDVKRVGRTALGFGDHVVSIKTGDEFVLSGAVPRNYAAVNISTGYRAENILTTAVGANFTREELEVILGNLDNWEVKE